VWFGALGALTNLYDFSYLVRDSPLYCPCLDDSVRLIFCELYLLAGQASQGLRLELLKTLQTNRMETIGKEERLFFLAIELGLAYTAV
jgi:hypothetical protein